MFKEFLNVIGFVLFIIIGTCYIGSLAERHFWEKKYLETLSENADLSKDNKILRDSIRLIKELSPNHY